jgi:hypothetical protein
VQRLLRHSDILCRLPVGGTLTSPPLSHRGEARIVLCQESVLIFFLICAGLEWHLLRPPRTMPGWPAGAAWTSRQPKMLSRPVGAGEICGYCPKRLPPRGGRLLSMSTQRLPVALGAASRLRLLPGDAR